MSPTIEAPARTAALAVDGLSVAFRTPGGRVQALTDAGFVVEPGDFLVVVGESGSGKSVLAHAIMQLSPRNAEVSGSARLGDTELLALDDEQMRLMRGRHIAFIPQSPASALNPVRRLVSLLTEIARARGLEHAGARDALVSGLEELGLDFDELARRYAHQLSGGMQQRVVNALALVGQPELVIADEPTSGLDADLVDATATQLRRIAERGAAVLVITHDLALAERLGGRLALLYASYVVELRPTAEFFRGPAHPYGQGLLGALPERGGTPIPGTPPELIALPAGCTFAARCPARMPECTAGRPDPYPVADGHGLVRCLLHAGS
ncbi:MAG: ABC transporter ATP-binding protein [Thermoleophilaceae bacterium]